MFHQGSNEQILFNGEKNHQTHFKTISTVITRNAGSILFPVTGKQMVKLSLTSMGER